MPRPTVIGGNKHMEKKMESIVQVVRGDSLDASSEPCIFCGRIESQQMFFLTAGKKYDGVLAKGFPICAEHQHKLDALLSGEFDIDLIELEKFRKPAGRALRFRG
jgi:hypothetical protein